MNTIIDNLINWLIKFRNKDNTFGINTDFQIIDVARSMPQEHKDWVIVHGGFDKFPWNGKGQRLAVLDTGCDLNHQDLIGSVSEQNFIINQRDNDRLDSHGTFCIGEVVARSDGYGAVGVAHNATCFSGRVIYGDERDTSMIDFEKALAAGIRASVAEGCGAISMSLGSSRKSPLVEDALAYAVDNGVIPFAASGNEGMKGSPYASYPASFSDCISVAAMNEKDLPTWFSTEGIRGTPEQQPEMGISSLEFYWGCIPYNRYGKMIGTSQACPMAAGVSLLWRQAMQARGTMPTGRNVLNEFRRWIKKVANDTNKNGWDASMGWGVLLLEDDEL